MAKTLRTLPTRRELLKLSPLLLGGAFFVPTWLEALLSDGVAFSDWFSGLMPSFRTVVSRQRGRPCTLPNS